MTIEMHTMKAKDLRLGNLVEFIDFPAKYFTQITPKILKTINDSPENHTWFSIRLTPEILEKCGFVSSGSFYEDNGTPIEYPFVLETENGIISINETKAYVYSGLGDVSSYGFEVKIEYLHQLQNLCFTLTGQELEINLKSITDITLSPVIPDGIFQVSEDNKTWQDIEVDEKGNVLRDFEPIRNYSFRILPKAKKQRKRK